MLAASLFAISGIFVSWSAYYRLTEEIPAEGGSFTEGVIGQPSFINPLIANGNGPDEDLMELLFSDMGELAESYAGSPDGKSWTMTLKEGLSWDDDKPITAADMIFTIETIQDQDAGSPGAGAWQGIIAEKISDREVRFTLREKNAFFENLARSLRIAPEHIFAGIPITNMRLSDYNLEPVGSGPYSWEGTDVEKDGFIREIRLAPNGKYHGTPPLVPEFSIRFYENEEDLARAFNAKQIDGAGGVSQTTLPSLAIEYDLKAIYLPRYYALFFNKSTNPALKEKAVRQALSRSIDRARIVSEVFEGYASPSYGPISPGIEGYDSDKGSGQGTMSPEAAGKMLETEGWLMNPEDGVRYKSMGKERIKLRIDVVVPDIPFLVQAMEIVEAGWKRAGAEANITVMNAETVAETALRTRNYQALLFGNVLKRDPDIYAFWHSSRKFHPGLNLSLYDNAEADSILEMVRQGTGDAKGRSDAVLKLQRLIADEAPAAFLFNPAYLYATPKGLKGFEEGSPASASDRLENAASWYRKTKRVLK